jgi:hypothetical protein
MNIEAMLELEREKRQLISKRRGIQSNEVLLQSFVVDRLITQYLNEYMRKTG